MNAWLAWSHRLADFGPANFYSDNVWTQYTPGFLYFLWGVGKLGLVHPFVIKLPAIFADIILSILIFKRSRSWILLFALNPAIIFVSSIWGQIDSLVALFLFLSVYFSAEKKQPVKSALAWSVAFLLKPQAVALLPILAIIYFQKFKFSEIIKASFLTIFVILLASFPFFPKNPIFGLPQLITKMGQHYHYTSVFAFNFWELITGAWIPDSPYFILGAVLYILAVSAIIIKTLQSRHKNYYLASAMTCLAFFLFPTRVHERYIFPFFVFLLPAVIKNKKILWIYILTSLAFLINLYYPYAYYNDNFLKSQLLLSLADNLKNVVALIYLFTFFYLLGFSPKIKNPLFWILIFALVSRLLFLWLPKTEYFDEVYHAFTARRMLHGDPKAWEWWNTPPQGFAYEWTHPPLAKLGMVLGMSLFGENSFGWRLPAALLGTGSVYLVFVIAAILFNKKTAILSALVFSLDGLALTTSRIGMNDSYFLFFMLLSLYLFIKNKTFSSSVSLGLAAAGKWTVFWFLPVLVLAHFALKKKFTPKYIWFLVIPPTIYFLSYLPMFLVGNHDLHTFIEVQKQMWWYHTNLKATHPYTSPWWSWPFLLRPIWLYTSSIGSSKSNIYAMGNPLIFWGGAVAAIYSLYISFKQKNKNLAFIIFSYLIFFVPWAASPRIMFLYHYLPSLPFISILLGFSLTKTKKFTFAFLLSAFILFVYFYPHWTGIPIPQGLDNSYYWFKSWK